ncbi:uncharacterized protein LOC131857700 [Cryptomeria japonica]|uniref:uncharacterized protein LOC131857700 n=1 Tax=Cryptomeria japonica TaxID=3369 RepID=UPI0027DA888A|nr:uncharacterized protein LOC131857700 [Cryptomeria japonica]
MANTIPINEKSQEDEASSSDPKITPVVPISMVSPLQELQDTPTIESNPEPNPEASPTQTEEGEGSSPPKKSKRKRGLRKVVTDVLEGSEEETPKKRDMKKKTRPKKKAKSTSVAEETLAPKARKSTPKKRKSNKDGEEMSSAEEALIHQTPPVNDKEEVAENPIEVAEKEGEIPKRKEVKKKTPPKNKVESTSIAEETP